MTLPIRIDSRVLKRTDWSIWHIVFFLLAALCSAWIGEGLGGKDFANSREISTVTEVRWRISDETTSYPATLPHQPTDSIHGPRSMTYEVPVAVVPDQDGSVHIGACITRWAHNGEIAIDGRTILRVREGVDGLADSRRPMFVQLPTDLSAGMHVMSVTLKQSSGRRVGLGPIWLGSASTVRQECTDLAESTLLRQSAPTVVVSVVGLTAWILAWLTRSRLTTLLALTCTALVIHSLHVMTHWWEGWLPMTPDAWLVISYITRLGMTIPGLLFMLDYAGRLNRSALVGIPLGFSLACVVLLGMPAEQRAIWAIVVGLLIAVVALVAMTFITRDLMRERSFLGFMIFLALSFGVLNGIMTILRRLGFIDFNTDYVSYISAPLMLTAIFNLMIDRMIRSARLEATLAERMRHQLKTQRERIAEDYAVMKRQSEQLAALQERRRIMQDMHDGVGSQLVSANAVLQASTKVDIPQMREMMRHILDDLRSVLDVLSLEPSDSRDDDPIGALLGTLRQRMSAALAAKGISLKWNVDGLPADFLVRESQRLHLLRLLQEALGNVIKHSGATQVTVSAHAAPDAIDIEIADNGHGRVLPREGGVGLASMRQRAQSLAAQLEITGLPGQGTRVHLRWARGIVASAGW